MKINDLIELYSSKYYDFFDIKKYKNPDIKYVEEAMSLIKDEYLDLIYNIIIKNNTYFTGSKNGSYFTTGILKGETATVIATQFDVDSESSLIHELGHCCDHIRKEESNDYSVSYKINKEGETLKDMIFKEVDTNHKVVFDKIIKECDDLVNKELGEGMYELFLESKDLEKEERKLRGKVGSIYDFFDKSSRFKNRPDYEENIQKYKIIQNRIGEIHSGSIINDVENSKSIAIIDEKYSIITDFLGIKYDVHTYYGLSGHPKSYYKKNKDVIVFEFFANMFCAELIGNEVLLNTVKDNFPKSYNGFYELFEQLIEIYNK